MIANLRFSGFVLVVGAIMGCEESPIVIGKKPERLIQTASLRSNCAYEGDVFEDSLEFALIDVEEDTLRGAFWVTCDKGEFRAREGGAYGPWRKEYVLSDVMRITLQVRAGTIEDASVSVAPMNVHVSAADAPSVAQQIRLEVKRPQIVSYSWCCVDDGPPQQKKSVRIMLKIPGLCDPIDVDLRSSAGTPEFTMHAGYASLTEGDEYCGEAKVNLVDRWLVVGARQLDEPLVLELEDCPDCTGSNRCP